MVQTNAKHVPNCISYGLVALFLSLCALYVAWRHLPNSEELVGTRSFKTGLGPVRQGSTVDAQFTAARRNYNSATTGNKMDNETGDAPQVEHGKGTKHAENSAQGLLELVHCLTCNEATALDVRIAEVRKKQATREVGRLECLRAIRNRVVDDYRPFFKDINRVVLIDVSLHGNLGDSVLWRAAVHLATLFGHSVNLICAGSQKAPGLYSTIDQFPSCNMTEIADLVQDKGLVLYHPGGNWGTLYRDIQEYRMRAMQFLAANYTREEFDFKVVQLPQSIAYEGQPQAAIAKDDLVMNQLPPGMLTLFLRQKDSLDFANEHYGSDVEKILSPDTAFVLGPLDPIGEPLYDILVLCRADKEIRKEDADGEEEIKTFLQKSNVTYTMHDWSYTPHIHEFSASNPEIMSEVRLNAAVTTVSKGKIVITDRMHGSVVATLAGRLLLWVDTQQEKLSRTREVAFNVSDHCTDENLGAFKFPTLLSAAKAAVEYLNQDPGRDLRD